MSDLRPPLAKHDSSVLDLAFAMDCTGSMMSYIDTAQRNIRNIVESIVAEESSDIHLALVEYRDHPPQDRTFVTRTHDFTPSVKIMKGWLDDCSAQGGGDVPEAVADALHCALHLSWRQEATKICVLISDAPPHGLGNNVEGFPNGCPDKRDPMQIGREMAQHGITLYTVGCEPAVKPYKDFFAALAYMTGGQYVPLAGAKALTQVIIGGAQEEISLEKWMEEVDQEVEKEMNATASEDVNVEAVTRKVWTSLRGKGARGKQLKRNDLALSSASSKVKKWATYGKISEVKGEFESDSLLARGSVGRGTRGGRGGTMCSRPRSRSRSKDRKRSRAKGRSRSRSPAVTRENENFSIEEDEICLAQAERLVQKSVMRKKGGKGFQRKK